MWGYIMGFLIDIVPIQFINDNFIREFAYASVIVYFIVIAFLSIVYNFYTSKLRYLIIGIWFGTFIACSLQLFLWIFSEWELISSSFSLILSLYFSALYQIFEALENRDLTKLIS